MMETLLERIRTDHAAGKQLSADDCWFLIEEVSRYRDLLRKARYQTIHVTVTVKDEGDTPVISAHVVASEESTERALIRELRRQFIRVLRLSQSKEGTEP